MTENHSGALFSLFCSLLAFGFAGSMTYQLANHDLHGAGFAALDGLLICLGLIHVTFTAVRLHWTIATRESRS